MLKKLVKFILTSVLAGVFVFTSCPNGTDTGSTLDPAPEVIPEGYIRINYKGDADCLWIWQDFDTEEMAKLGSWPDGIKFAYQNGDFVCVDLKLAENPSFIGMIPISNGNSLTGDVIFYFPGRYNQIYLQKDDTNAYVSSDMKTIAEGISGASFTSGTLIKLTGNSSLSSENVVLTDKDGNNISITSYDSSKLTLTLSSSVQETYAKEQPYTLKVVNGDYTDTLIVSLNSSLIDSWYGSKAVEEEKVASLKLGVTVTNSTASFKTWAPLSSQTKLLLYKDSDNLSTADQTVDMVLSNSGFWIAENVDVSSYKYYKFSVKNGLYEKQVADIWSNAASMDAQASQIADISTDGLPQNWESSYTNPWNGERYNDAVIYEMHIRDWSRAVVTDSTGKFLDIANSDEIVNHLKDLGITHVQILPMFEYAKTNPEDAYNWGYNPYHYNVPESRYAKDMTDGTDAVSQMRTMIKKFHDAGIAVIMDVVYNHTSGTNDGSLYDMTVPQYFYRTDSNGNYSNGSGCGNEIATNHAMAKYYVIESLKHWMNDYHINGFRFDLMGCLEASTMKEIYDALYQIDNKVMVYGEPWTGGTSAVSSGATSAGKGTSGWGYGAFDDDYRDAIKGGEYGGFKRGNIQGDFENNKKLLNGFAGTSSRNSTGYSGLTLHYAECHDNYTLFDKLVYATDSSVKGDGNFAPKFASIYKSVMSNSSKLKLIKSEDKLAAAYVLLAQGTPFINGGQEFLRSKKGNPDSYAADTKGGITWTNTAGDYNIDDVNTIDLSMKTTYSDVYNTYKALIKIRKDIDAFRNGQYADATTLASTTGAIKYVVYSSDAKEQYWVLYNGTDSAVSTTIKGKKFTINENDGTYIIADSNSEVGSVPAKSFVILKK